jgi:riboflavin synthase
MFTGIIATLGRIESLAKRSGGGARLGVQGRFADRPLVLGESIAVDGVCLTVARMAARGFEADLAGETLARTTAGSWRKGRRVNLERALAVGDRFGGHMVQGHVDGRGRVIQLVKGRGQTTMRVQNPRELGPLIAEKGSIAIDGISLTVTRLGPDWFEVALIPHTLEETNLSDRKVRDPVNLEVDLIARYLARLLEPQKSGPARRT